ncbi:4-phosphopantetheinyl transferase [Paracoccus sp. MBLB3053]|uniref:4-phosphopantetheinyl transferase n=1 Tax=Paracoccus aurantius TaxID=3073814 RepID=A0ABU2HMT6_9RHOB|nr:4-phosphopantetheinyl transferase [Paracoccus sp. MBLB3053]MDS9466347.1 4-phosphopantetheinyl transferase [Paracoccus sp. MBLB3053]
MSDAEALRRLAQRLIPAGYASAVAPLDGPVPALLPDEACVVLRAVPKRWREFAIGRAVLREAIRGAGHNLPADLPIRARPDRMPDLPEGVRASLSHAGRFCIAIAAPPGGASVGIDLEPLDGRRLGGLADAVAPYRMDRDDALLAFCIKEALFKAQFPLTGRMLDFSDVPVAISGSRARACLGRRLISARWGKAVGHYLAISLWRG